MAEIELTNEQRQALQAEQGKPSDVVDPATGQRFVLLSREQYERVRGLLEQTAKSEPLEPVAEIAPGILRSQKAFWRDLPGLLQGGGNHGKWVAYHGEKRIGLGKTSTALYQHCLQRGLQRGEFYVGRIEERDTPPWGITPLERSLYEASDLPAPGAATSSL
jgi:hypothetical protein